MTSSLVNGLTDVFKSQALGSFAANSGESESSVLRGFEATMGTMVAGLASKVGQTGGGRQILDLINNPANDERILDNARGLVDRQPSDGLGSNLTSMLFGSRLSAITDTIGSASGLRAGTAASLMNLGAPLLLGWLGRRVHQGMDPSRLSSFLSEEAAGVRGALPTGVRNLLTTETAAPITSAVVDERKSSVPPIASGVVEERKSRGWLWPLIAALAVVLGLLWWLNSRRSYVAAVQTPTVDYITRNLPGNVALHIPAGRMEDHLLGFIQDPSRPVDSTTWFDFDRLLFDTNSATLQPSSQEQLQNIAAILKAYPNVHLKIGGYTDNTGDPNANLTLSQQRADSVEQQLVGMGISADRMEAQGYGDQHPVGDNSTEEGRQRNRRISMLLTQK